MDIFEIRISGCLVLSGYFTLYFLVFFYVFLGNIYIAKRRTNRQLWWMGLGDRNGGLGQSPQKLNRF